MAADGRDPRRRWVICHEKPPFTLSCSFGAISDGWKTVKIADHVGPPRISSGLDGIVIKRIQFPVPTTAEDLLRRFEEAITPRTRVLQLCHITNVTGQLFPVRELSLLARQRGIVTLVDGAQAIAHFSFALRDLGCDVYGTGLHKWLMAPHGTGFLYVRRDQIERIWWLQGALDSFRDDIRKFEEIGTQPAAARAAIADALAFHQCRLRCTGRRGHCRPAAEKT